MHLCRRRKQELETLKLEMLLRGEQQFSQVSVQFEPWTTYKPREGSKFYLQMGKDALWSLIWGCVNQIFSVFYFLRWQKNLKAFMAYSLLLANWELTECLRVTEALKCVAPKSTLSCQPPVLAAGFPPAEVIAYRSGNGLFKKPFRLLITSTWRNVPLFQNFGWSGAYFQVWLRSADSASKTTSNPPWEFIHLTQKSITSWQKPSQPSNYLITNKWVVISVPCRAGHHLDHVEQVNHCILN